MNKYLIFLMLIPAFAFSQAKPKSVSKKAITEKFNPSVYKNITPSESSIYDKTYVIGSKKIRIIEDPKIIQVEENQIGSQFKTIKVFNARTRLLKAQATRFSNFEIGTSKEYNSKGYLVRVHKNESAYPFSPDDLIAKMKTMGIDITKNPELHFVNRYNEKGGPPTYTLMIRETRHAMKVRLIEVNGITGATISDRITYMEE